MLQCKARMINESVKKEQWFAHIAEKNLLAKRWKSDEFFEFMSRNFKKSKIWLFLSIIYLLCRNLFKYTINFAVICTFSLYNLHFFNSLETCSGMPLTFYDRLCTSYLANNKCFQWGFQTGSGLAKWKFMCVVTANFLKVVRFRG